MDLAVAVIFLLISFYGIHKSGQWVVKSAVNLSEGLKIGTFLFGFVIVSVSTTLPEFFVAISSSLKGVS